MQQLTLGDISVDVIHKEIKNVHLSVYPPTGRVRIAAPFRMNLEAIRAFAISKMGWIKKQQSKLKEQQRETPREYLTRESHYYLGERYLLKVIEHTAPPKVILKPKWIELYVREGAGAEHRERILNEWYRQRLNEIVPKSIANFEKVMTVKVSRYGIKKMKTKWGSCNREAKRIWLNLELAKKPMGCIEYIVAHEMVHLIERYHNLKFVTYMDKFMPRWRYYRDELNLLPVGHAKWNY